MEKSDIQKWVEEGIAAVFERRDEASNLHRDTHTEHHEWLAARIAKEAEKAEFWRNIRTKSIPWAIAALASTAGAAFWTAFKTYFTEHWK